MSEPQDTKESLLKKYGPWIGRLLLSVLGFLSVWMFNSVIQLKEAVAEIKDNSTMESAQWQAIHDLSVRMQQVEISTRVNAEIQRRLLDAGQLRKDEPPRELEKLLDEVEKAKNPQKLDSYIEQQQIEQRTMKK